MRSLIKTKDISISVATQFNSGRPINLERNMVHFFFCDNGNLKFGFGPHYERILDQGSYFIIYDSEKDLPVALSSDAENGVDVVHIVTTTKYIHSVLIEDIQNEVTQNFDGFGVRNYAIETVPLAAESVLESLVDPFVPTALKSVYYRAKVLELLSYCYNVPESDRFESCPFLKDKDNIVRIKNAKRILLLKMVSPPSIKELSKEIGMNEYNLKVGFKNIYGMPPYQYLKEYKLNYSKSLLQKGFKVNEIADQIGYNSSSHYIEAFRKRFGTTPRKYAIES